MDNNRNTPVKANLMKKEIGRFVLYTELSKYYTADQIDQMLVDIATHGTIDLNRYVKKTEVDSALSPTSEMPVQNKVIYEKLMDYYNKEQIDEMLSQGGHIVDPTPTKDSPNAVSSGGVYDVTNGTLKTRYIPFDLRGKSIIFLSDEDMTELFGPATMVGGQSMFDLTVGEYQHIYRVTNSKSEVFEIPAAYHNANGVRKIVGINGNLTIELSFTITNGVYVNAAIAKRETSIPGISYEEEQDLTAAQRRTAQQNIGLEKDVAGGVAGLNESGKIEATQMPTTVVQTENGKVPASVLPSYVDDVTEGYYGSPIVPDFNPSLSYSAGDTVGYNSKIYRFTKTHAAGAWNPDDVEEVKPFPVTGETGKVYSDIIANTTYRWSGSTYTQIKGDLSLGETSETAFAGNRGKALEQQMPLKQDTIQDLSTIRNNALYGPTSVQFGAAQQLTPTQQVNAQNNMMGKAYSSVAADHSGLGKVYLQKNNGSLTQAMINTANTVYVIQYDYTLAADITFPAGCTLKFDGGSITPGNHTLSGTISNSYLSVADFTTTNDITDAINKILPIANVYIPKGDWYITSSINTEGIRHKQIFGDGLTSCVTLKNNSQFYIYDTWFFNITNLFLKLEITNSNYAIRLAGKNRYITVSDINIEAEQQYNTSIQGSGIQIENPVTSEYMGNVYCTFDNINIKFVVIGILINMDVQRTTDYITSSSFTNIHIDSFKSKALQIKGIRCYSCCFDKLSIADNWDSGDVNKYGIIFAGFLNQFRGISIWADCRNSGSEFYALWIDEEIQASGPSYFDGYVEGEIGGTDWIINFNRILYNFIFHRVKSIDNTIIHSARTVSNYIDTGSFKSIINKENLNGQNFNIYGADSCSGKTVDGNLKVTSSSNEDSNFSFQIHTSNTTLTPGYKYRIFAIFELEKTTSTAGGFNIRLINGDSTVSYLSVDSRYSNHLCWSAENNYCVENAVSSYANVCVLRISATTIKSLVIKQLCIVPYTDDNSPLWSIRKDLALNALHKDDFLGYVNKESLPILYDTGIQVFDADTNKPAYINKLGGKINALGFSNGLLKGTTANRPQSISDGGILNGSIDIGYQYYDETLNKPIWVKDINGSQVTWVDATGTTV